VKVSWVQTARRKTEGAMRDQVRQGGTRLYQGFGEGSEITMLVVVLAGWQDSGRGLEDLLDPCEVEAGEHRLSDDGREGKRVRIGARRHGEG
jgi:hypothetical protein